MASFFDDLFEGLTGQQATPQQTIIPTGELFSQAGALLPQLAGSEVAYNAAVAPGLTDVQLGVEQQIAPGTFDLRSSAIRDLQKNLDLGYRLPPELQDLVTTQALQGLSSSGAGVSNLGQLFNARSLTGAGLNFEQQNLSNALNASRFQPQFNERQPFGSAPGMALAGDIRDVQAARDDYENLKEDIRRQNFSSMINTGGRIIGGVVGGIYGGAAGAQMGSQIGGSLYTGSRVGGQPPKSGAGSGAGGGGFGSLLSMFGGGGGGMGQYSAGGGQYYGGEMGGAPLQQSTMASGVNIAGF